MEHNYEQLLSLWESNFGDDKKYIEHFFENYKERMKTFVLRVEDRIVSSCYLLPAFISTENGTEKPVWYLYALSTREEERGKGYARQLLTQITEDYFLVPVKGLENFYEKSGLKRWLATEQREVAATGNVRVGINIVFAKDIVKPYEIKRNEAFKKEGYIRWDYQALQYALKEHEFCGGKILHIREGNEDVFILLSMDADTVYIKEITAENSRWDEFAALAAGFFEAEKAVILGKIVMVSKDMEVKKGQGYFGLTLG